MSKNQRGLLATAVLNYCLIVFMGFSFCAGQSTAFPDYYYQGISQHKNTVLLTPAGSYNNSGNPFSLPFIAELLPEEVEMPDDVEADGQSDVAFSELFHDPFSQMLFDFSPQSNLFEHLTQSIQNRSTASLVVLYHSWKSFLI